MSNATVTVDASELVDLKDKMNELIEVTNRQNELLESISEQITPVLDQMKNSPIGMMLGMK